MELHEMEGDPMEKVKSQANQPRLLATFILSLLVSGILLLGAITPAAAVGQCNGAGWLCFWDFGTSTWGNVSGNNNQ